MTETQKYLAKVLGPAVVIGTALEIYQRRQDRKLKTKFADGRRRMEEMREGLIDIERENRRRVQAAMRKIDLPDTKF